MKYVILRDPQRWPAGGAGREVPFDDGEQLLEDVLVVVWAATGDVANSDSTMRDARFISKKAPVNRPSLGDRRRAPWMSL